ncbi:MAG: hypothetical protein H7334_15430 [Ferruginibacter sp.]|nr:hypothetical protein [Ferruginibacter sp.]
MKLLNLSEFDTLSELSKSEMCQLDGGNFWYDLAYVAGAIVKGIQVFAEEGGRNAGACVR